MRRRLSALAAMMALALTLAVGTDVAAQDNPTAVPTVGATEIVGGAESTVTTVVDDATDTVDDKTDDSGRWGLLGLLGLAGLAGLLKRPTRTVVDQTRTFVEPTATRVTDVRTDIDTTRRP